MAGSVQLKEFAVGIDLKKAKSLRPFEVVDGDTGNRITITLFDDGEPVDMTDLRVMAVFSSSRGVSVQDSTDGTVTVNGNEAVIDLLPASFATGVVECELRLYSSTDASPNGFEDFDVLVTTAKFNFSCRAAMLSDDAVHSFPQFPLLTQLAQELAEAEANREARLAQLLQEFGAGVKLTAAAPTSETDETMGRILVVRNANEAYMLTSVNIHSGSMEHVWKQLAFESPWEDLKKITLAEDSSSFEFTADSNGDEFAYDELRLVMIGAMKNSSTAHIRFNGRSDYIRDTGFMNRDADEPWQNISIVHLKRMENGFACCEKHCGGVIDIGGYASMKNNQCTFLYTGYDDKYTRISVEAGAATGLFGAGTVIKLQGRNMA